MKGGGNRPIGKLDRYAHELEALGRMLGLASGQARQGIRRARRAILAADRELARRQAAGRNHRR